MPGSPRPTSLIALGLLAAALALAGCAAASGPPSASLPAASAPASSAASLPTGTPASSGPITMDACAVFSQAELETALGVPMAPGVPTLPTPSGVYGFCVTRPVSGPGSVGVTLDQPFPGQHLKADTPGQRLVSGVGQEALLSGHGDITVIIRSDLLISILVYMPDNTIGSDDLLISLAQLAVSHLP